MLCHAMLAVLCHGMVGKANRAAFVQAIGETEWANIHGLSYHTYLNSPRRHSESADHAVWPLQQAQLGD